MPSVFAVGRYWCGVFGRAFLDTWRFLGHNVKKSVMSAIGVFITIVLIGAAEEESARALLRFHWWLYGAAGAVALFVLVMIVMILRTPPVVQEEAVRKETAATEPLQAELASLRAANAAAQTHPLSEAVQAELRALIARGKMINELVSGAQEREAEGMSDCLAWQKAIRDFVKQRIPSEYNRLLDKEFPFGSLAEQRNVGFFMSFVITRLRELEYLLQTGSFVPLPPEMKQPGVK